MSGAAMKKDAPTQSAARCPICREPTVAAYRPFCSGRCADVDLGRWVTGAYVIPASTEDDDEDGDSAVPHGSPTPDEPNVQ